MSGDLTQDTQRPQASPVTCRAGRRRALHVLGAAALGLSGSHATVAKDKRNRPQAEKRKKKAKPGPTGPTGPTGPAGGSANIPNPLKSITVESSDGTTPAIILKMVNNQAAPLMVLQSPAGVELLRLTADDGNTWLGEFAGSSAEIGSQDNTGIGSLALQNVTTANSNTALGALALQNNFTASNNTAVGVSALRNVTQIANTAVGMNSMSTLTNGSENTAVGFNAAVGLQQGARNTALGVDALKNSTDRINCTALGYASEVNGNDQVQLGDSATTTYAYGAVQNRSDLRDKADIRDTALGLAFIQQLRPVDFRWDYREDYRSDPPEAPGADASAVELSAYQERYAAWQEASRFSNLQSDGSKARTRFHHGLIAQEVAEVIARTGIDFGGYQDHTIKGGEDVRSLGYGELIAPLIKAVQELATRNDELEARLRALEESRSAEKTPQAAL